MNQLGALVEASAAAPLQAVAWRQPTQLPRPSLDRAQAGVAVLDIENGVVEAGLLGNLEIELDVRARASRQEEKAKRVSTRSPATGRVVDFIHHFVDRHHVAGALAALYRHAVLGDENELVEERFEALLGQVEGRQRIAHARDVAHVVRTEDIDEKVVSTRDLVREVRDIRSEVGPRAIAFLDD